MFLSKGMILFQVVAKFSDVSCSLMYDVLHDGDYRRCWDDNMVECYEICQLDRFNDIGYYSSKSIFGLVSSVDREQHCRRGDCELESCLVTN